MTENNFDIIPYAEKLLSDNNSDFSIMQNMSFLPMYLSKNIGRWIKVEHVIGDTLVSHIGQLISCGADYIVLKSNSDILTTIICNIKDIRFITVIYENNSHLLK